MPEIQEDQRVVLELAMLGVSQQHSGFGGPYAFNMADMESIARSMGIPWCEYVTRGLVAISGVISKHSQASSIEPEADSGTE